MYKNIFILFLISIFVSYSAFSQTTTISGKVADIETKNPLISATVIILDKNNNQKYHAISNKLGEFNIKNIKPDTYKIKITYIGYTTYEKIIKLSDKDNINLGTFSLKSLGVKTQEVEVTAQAPLGEQKEDTTEFNAKSFKTMPDATAEDIIKKMPGVQIESDGKIKSQGEEVKKVIVDGKPFFGDDPSLTLKSIPSEVVDKVQVYDKMSDQAEFTGFDDGQSEKTINIITKKDKRKGQFGRLEGGYGYEDRYSVNMNVNLFNDEQRISFIGMSNNVNQQHFSIQDIMSMTGSSGGPGGGMMRMGSGPTASGGARPPMGNLKMPSRPGGSLSNYMVSQMEGLNKIHAFGFNLSDNWFNKIDVTLSYFFNYTDNNNDQYLSRNYMLSLDSIQNYYQNNPSYTKNINHRFNMKFNYQIDSANSILIRPALIVQTNNMNNNLFSANYINNTTLLNTSSNDYTSDYTGINFSNEILYKHRFNTPGRTISFSLNTSYNDKSGNSNQYTISEIFADNHAVYDTTDQQTDYPVTGYGISANTIFTEQIHKNGQIQLNYTISYTKNKTDKQTYDFSYLTNDYSILDTSLSNKFNNDYITNNAGLGYRLKTNSYSLIAMLNYEHTKLSSEQVFPNILDVDYSYQTFLPSVRMDFKFSRTSNLRLHYRTSTNIPGIQQLQNVIDNSSPTQLTTGNPLLQQEYAHSLNFRYANFSKNMTNVFMTFFGVNYRSDYIGNSIFLAQKDTLINNSVLLAAGGQLTKPVNLDGYWNVNAFMNYGFQVPLIASNLNFNLGGSYSKTPSLINDLTNNSNAYNFNCGFMLGSNISENVDFMIGSRANFNITHNTIQTSSDNNYNVYMNNINLKWIIWEGFFIQAEASNQFYTGLVDEDEDNNFTLLNFAFGKKFLANNAGELKLTVFDALNQNKSIQTNVTDYYVEYTKNQVLQQYVLLTFTYNLRNFGATNEFKPRL